MYPDFYKSSTADSNFTRIIPVRPLLVHKSTQQNSTRKRHAINPDTILQHILFYFLWFGINLSDKGHLTGKVHTQRTFPTSRYSFSKVPDKTRLPYICAYSDNNTYCTRTPFRVVDYLKINNCMLQTHLQRPYRMVYVLTSVILTDIY